MIFLNRFAPSWMPKIEENQSGDSKIIKINPTQYSLVVNNKTMMTEDVSNDFSQREFYGCYQLSTGNVLTSGLGFGIFAEWVATKNEVESVTVLEKSIDVINMYEQINMPNPKIKIVNEDINNFYSSEHFNTLVLDHYEQETYDEQIENMRKIFSQVPNHNIFYAWRTELIYADKMLSGNFDLVEKINRWQEFNEYMQISTLPDLSEKQIRDFFYMFCVKKLYKDFPFNKSLMKEVYEDKP